jgi:Tfp pilus assembly protein PilV
MRRLMMRVIHRSFIKRTCATGERGETLVELLMTVVIMGIAFTALLAGLGTAVGSTRTHRQQANADIVVPAVADAIKSNTSPNTYKPCNTVTVAGVGTSYDPTPSTAAVPLPTGWADTNITITAVKGWNATTNTWVPCTSSVTDTKLELVTIQIDSPGSPSAQEIIDIVKRDPA